MCSKQRPKLKITFYPENVVQSDKLQVLQKLQNTNALILKLTENIKGNVFNKPIPFITFQRVLSSEEEELPKLDGDPWSDYFISLQSFKHTETELTRNLKSGFIVLAFKVMDDCNTQRFDQGWSEWSGAISLTASLSRRKYEIRKVACYKGVNICPEIFKYMVLIEFLIPEG